MGFGEDQGYRLHPENFSPLFADLSPLRMFRIVFRVISLYPK